ncbi:FtsX-like permease family protein [Umezawaea endophytica]|uniref:ABC transporter permease n=1 Tax=Umezawaea endophytica TaxID=1654476 RepID=A0A9X2VLX2_9PSEU|nr:FtsX-like permease family protein [Umezawaea endophytica]MCS7479000.1 ABC transporter permease [Umezawaea endophytica]
MNPVSLAFTVLRADTRSRVSALLVAVGVALGVVLVLWLLAAPDALQSRAERESWRGDTAAVSADDPRAAVVVARNRDDLDGRMVERFDVAALRSGVAVAAGIPFVPGPGEVLLSPALAKLDTGNRFSDRVIGSIGVEALRHPDELVAIIGHEPGALRGATRPDLRGPAVVDSSGGLLHLLTSIGLVVLVVPCLVLVASAARLTATRRERRLAALRLAGATPAQVIAMTAAETAFAAVVGSVLGAVASIPLRHLTTSIPWDGGTWLLDDFTASPLVVLLVVLLAPVLVVAAAVLGLRRVVTRPLGAVQQHSPSGPSPLRLVLLAGAGVVFFVGVGLGVGGTTTVLIGLAAVAAALVLAGPLVMAAVGKVFVGSWRRPSTLLAGRRLSDDPKAAFRSAAGVVLAVFTASMALVVFPSLSKQIQFSDGSWRDDVLVAESIGGGQAQVDALRADLDRLGVTGAVVPMVAGYAALGAEQPEVIIAPCEDGAKVLSAIADVACAGTPAIYAPEWQVDRLKRGADLVLTSGDKTTALPANLPVRTYEATPGRDYLFIDPALIPGLTAAPSRVAVTTDVGNRAAVQNALLRAFPGAGVVSNSKVDLQADLQGEDLLRATAIGLTIAAVLGAVSAVVAAAGSVVDRRRTFAALVAAGTPVRVLTRALRAEVVLPVLLATTGAGIAGAAVGAGLTTITRGRDLVFTPWLAAPVVLGLVVALAAAASCGPVLKKVTAVSYSDG